MRFAKRLGLRYHPGRDALSARYGDLSMMVTIRERALNAGTATCNTCVTMPNLGLGIWIRPDSGIGWEGRRFGWETRVSMRPCASSRTTRSGYDGT